MAFIKTRRPSEASGEVLEMYQRQQDHWGYVPNYAKLFSHRPEVLARWGRLLAELRRPIDDRRFEMVTFVAACELKNSACALTHGAELAKFIGINKVLAIAGGREAEVLPEAEAAIVRFARVVARDASKVTEGQVGALKRKHGITDDEIFDIAAIAAGRSFFTKLLDALGCEADIAYMSFDKELREALSIGRPICQAPLEFTSSKHAA